MPEESEETKVNQPDELLFLSQSPELCILRAENLFAAAGASFLKISIPPYYGELTILVSHFLMLIFSELWA